MRADSAEAVARQGLAALKRGNNYKIVGADNYLQSLLPRVLSRKTVIQVVAKMMGSRVMKTLLTGLLPGLMVTGTVA